MEKQRYGAVEKMRQDSMMCRTKRGTSHEEHRGVMECYIRYKSVR